jgi:phage terminase small subunit
VVYVKLTSKQKRFVEEYLIDLNATQAAIRAGYSKKTANEQAGRLLVNVSIQTEIKKAMDERSKRTEIKADDVVKELAHIAFDDIKNYLRFYSDEDRNIQVEIKDSDTIDTRSVSEISIGKDGQFKFKMYCKDNALVQLGRHLGIFVDKSEVNLKTDKKLEDFFK